jgi:benzoyl-CoA 2,3-epoxidase subunit B
LRGEYTKDCERGLARSNKILAEEGVAERLYLPSRRFHRRDGEYAGNYFDIHGALWIAPPKTGVNHRPFDFEYVRL